MAKWEFTFSIPTLAKIEVAAAKTADNRAYSHHIISLLLFQNIFLLKVIHSALEQRLKLISVYVYRASFVAYALAVTHFA